MLILQSLQPNTLLKPSFDFTRGEQMIRLTKVASYLKQFMVGLTLFKPLPIDSIEDSSTRSIKNIIESPKQYLSAKENALLFFEMGKTNNTCVLRIHDPLLSQLSIL